MIAPAESGLARARPAGASLPPVIVFHGSDNALSIVRALGRRGIPVYVLNDLGADVQYSRYARPLPVARDRPFRDAAVRFLTGPESDPWSGAVLLAASDEALDAITRHRGRLQTKFRLDLSNPDAQRAMLSKLSTYRIASGAGVATPRFWPLDTPDERETLRSELPYPLIVKPIHSHRFEAVFRTKFMVVESVEELLRSYRRVRDAGMEVMLVEMIPGPDSLLCSYYTYLDEEGLPLFDFTKRIIRRFPTNMGLATYHVSDHVEGVKELALRLFRAAGLRGLANAEFKLDPRDGQLKLIECNARFTAANGLVAEAGLDLASLVYNRIVGLPLPRLDRYRDGVTLWDPARDYRAYRELRARGQLGPFDWLRSVLRPQLFPAFTWSDPVPGLARLRRRVRASGSP